MEKRTFTGHSTLYLAISGGIILLAVILSVFGLGINLGIDFTGGSLLKYEVGGAFEISDVEAALKEAGVTESQVAKAGANNTELQVRTKDLGESADDIRMAFEESLRAKYENLTFVELATVGGVAGRDLIRNALMSCLIVFVCLLVYVGIRFDFHSGLAALLALLHDVLIMCSFMVFFRSAYQVNSPFIAAVLTIIGYSINNTIVIFDRVRENAKSFAFKSKPRWAVVEASVSETLVRTVNTTVTTLLTLVTLYVLGVASIREFTFPLIVGMLAGVYSSVMVSSQLWARWIDNGTFRKFTALFQGKKAKKA